MNLGNNKNENGIGQELNENRPGFGFQKVPWVSKEMIRVHHYNPNYRKELNEYRNGLRKEKPKRRTSCYFDPWKQSPEVLGALIKKGKIHLR